MKKYVALGTISFLAFSSLFSMEVTLFDIISRDERLAHEATEELKELCKEYCSGYRLTFFIQFEKFKKLIACGARPSQELLCSIAQGASMRGGYYSPKACLHYILDHVPLSAQIKGDMLCAAFNYAEYHNLNILLLHERSTLPLVLKEAQVSRCLLQEAIRIRWPEGFDFLLKHGADPNVLLAEGETLLHILAKGSNRSECYYLERLLKAGADPDARNKNSETP